MQSRHEAFSVGISKVWWEKKCKENVGGVFRKKKKKPEMALKINPNSFSPIIDKM